MLFVLNHTDQAQIVPVPDGWLPLLLPEKETRTESIDEDLVLPAYEIALFEHGTERG
jgi:hypothetical protein